MKKLILLLTLVFMMCGCYRQNADGSYTVGNAFNEFNVLTIDTFDWLNSHHFDYRELIEKGLALEAPEEMYKV